MFATLAHRIFRLEKLAHCKDEIITGMCHRFVSFLAG